MSQNIESSHEYPDPFIGLYVNIADVRTRIEKYQPLIEGLRATQTSRQFRELNLGAPISKNFFTLDNPYVYAFAPKLRGKTLVDIGAGSASNIRSIAKKFGVPFLVEIEKNLGNENTEWDDVVEDGLHIIRFRGDILEALARFPDASANVMMNGIDHLVVPEGGYRTALFEEVVRIVPPSGLFFGYDSQIGANSRYKDPMPAGFIRSSIDDERNVNGKLFVFEREA